MSDNSEFDSLYSYDGSFDGLMCCLFTAYTLKQMPLCVTANYDGFLPCRNITSSDGCAERVVRGIIKTMGYGALNTVKRAYLSEREGIELNILKYLKLGFDIGASPHSRRYEDCVKAVTEGAKYTMNERHRIIQFLRFSDSGGILTAVISPKANVLPLIGEHFRGRFPLESFLIYDDERRYALVYANKKSAFVPLNEYNQPPPDADEQKYRDLFTLFYNTVEIKPRHNERCRMSHMPKRFWKNMTEFLNDGSITE